MKPASLAAILLFTASALAAETPDTAYTALRVVGKAKGAAVLNQVVELRGRSGMPHPAVWKIVLREAGARGGLRELDVQRGKIIAERTPTVAGVTGGPMDFTHLNLDSDGLFTVLEGEMRGQGQAFNRVDYVLRSGTGGGAPVWTADVWDGVNGKVAMLQVAADSGSVLARSGGRAPVMDSPNDRDFVTNTPPQQPARNPRYSQPGEPFRGVPDFFHRFGKRVQRHGERLENFVTGK